MPNAQVFGAVHAVILITLGWHSANRLTASALHRLAAIYLLTWCNLVFTGLILSLFSELNHVALYFSVSLVIAAAVDTFLRYRNILPHTVKAMPADLADGFFDRMVRRVLAATLLLA